MPKLGNRLKELRGDLSLYEVGKATGIDRSNIKRYEDGDMPKRDALYKLAEYYEVPFEELFYLWLEDTFPLVDERKLISTWVRQQSL